MAEHESTPLASFWQLRLAELLAVLHAGPAGLSTAEAEARREVYGPNLLGAHRERSLVVEFLLRLRNPLVLVLLAAAAVSALLRDVVDSVLIGALVLLSVSLDFVQERRASRAAERLRSRVAVRASVRRDGTMQELPVAQLVPGDVIELRAGDLVPADARVLEARDCFVNQALLTGESYPVEKRATEVAAGTEMAAAENALFMGTSVVGGMARALVCRTGPATVLGQISTTLATRPPVSAFERGTREFGLLVLRLTVLLTLFVLLVNAVFHRPLIESLLFALALAVGLTPELLPMVVTVTLARGALRMAERRVIVKRLSAVQDLGAMDVLCTDKTGTLTEGRIRLERHVDAAGRQSARVLELAYLNSRFETGLKSPLDEAILRHERIDVSAWHKIDEVPFDFERRRVSVLLAHDAERLLVVKGAPEDVLRLCTRYEADGPQALAGLDAAARRRIEALCEELGRAGFRTLAIAWRAVPSAHAHAAVTDETELVFAGFAGFLDPPKPGAAQVLAAIAASGVAVKIVTGDNELVTRHVCAHLGLAVQGVLTGAEIQQLDDHALQARAEQVNLFCRVTPAQKTRILAALRARGHTVGFLGDGVNDAPALHTADVGISVDSAVDVAREAADMILLEQDLGVLHEGVREGRRTIANVLKYIRMGMSSNFGNMFSMAGGTLLLPFLPLLPVQILLNNLLYDISEIAIPLDRVDEQMLARPRAWRMESVRRFMFIAGPVSSAFDFLTFFVLLHLFAADEALFHTGWFIESLVTQVLVIFVIRTPLNPLKSRPHAVLVASCLAVIAVAITLPYSPLGTVLGFVAPPPALLLALSAIVASYLVTAEIVKRWFYRRFGAAAF